MLGLLQSPASAAAGMQLVDAYQLWDKPVELPSWKDIVPLFQTLNAKELKLFPGVSCTHGWKYTTIVCDSQLYIRYLHNQFEEAGGRIQRRKVQNLSELAEFDLVVNCAGLASKQLFPDDKLTAVRGQVMRVRAPWVKHYINFNGQNYIIPNFDTVVLGGTTQRGNFDTTVSEEDTHHILEGCCKLVPSLRHAEVVSDWAGLRPARDRVRISLEKHKVINPWGTSKMLPVVHNYGHGGAGITLHWGCAEDAVALAKAYLAQQKSSKL